MYRLKVTFQIELPDEIATSPAELIEMFHNNEFVLTKEDIVDVSAVKIEKERSDYE
jgi:hypothetical protein|nr:hypothetical protein [uncultured Prevotella sp.]